MEMDSDDEILGKLAAGGTMDYALWPSLLSTVVSRIEKISANEFPIPIIPPPRQASPPPEPRLLAPLPSSDPMEPPPASNESGESSQETNKENTNPAPPALPLEPIQEPGTLPPQVIALMNDITAALNSSFSNYPPHTIQRLSELVISPKQHYRSLPAYLHALDRVVHVTSGSNIYPLPPAIPDMSAMSLAHGKDVWTNGATSPSINSSASASLNLNVGSDEALGGALLTPIPWLQRRTSSGSPPLVPAPATASSTPATTASTTLSAGTTTSADGQPSSSRRMEGQVRTESTETIEGPNGVGHIETVSVSVNGIPSHGAAALQLLAAQQQRGVTQGELLRQEQRAGVVPVSQLSQLGRSASASTASSPSELTPSASSEDDDDARAGAGDDEAMGGALDEAEVPHARGPEEIGAADTGPQVAGTAFAAANGDVSVHVMDIEAAVGRRAADPELGGGGGGLTEADLEKEAQEDLQERVRRESTPKREAEEPLGPEGPSKKLKEDVAGSAELTEKKMAEEREEEEPKTDVDGDVDLAEASVTPETGKEPAPAATEDAAEEQGETH